MFFITGPEIVLESCKAGIMGVLPLHNARTPDEFERWLATIRTGLDEFSAENPDARIGPLAVNIANKKPVDEISRQLGACRDAGVDIVVSAMRNPKDLAQVVHDWGGQLFHDVTSLKFAEKAAGAGVDGMTCIVSGGGGHSGVLNPFVFIPRVREFFDGTVLVAGGISTGGGVRAVQALGADLAYIGTRFIATHESRAPHEYKAMLVDSDINDLAYISEVTGVAANWLRGSLERVGLDPDSMPTPTGIETTDHLPPDIRAWRDIWSAGQSVGLIHDIPTVAELVARLVLEYRDACSVPDTAAV
jgi:nitronate monooxygenase